MKRVVGLIGVALVLVQAATDARAANVEYPLPAEVREGWALDPFYQKCVMAGPLPVVGSTNVSDYALLETHYVLGQLVSHRPEILEALAERRAKVVVMAHDEYTTDLPEQRRMKPKVYWDSRARGMGGRTCSCAEENMLCFDGDPYSTENIFIHEFAHVIHGHAMRVLDPTFAPRLDTAYSNAMARGLWEGTYAATNPGEYWAEAVQNWFDNNRANDALHNHVHTRAQLLEYDPEVAVLCREVFGDTPWRYQKPMDRAPSERTHLAGFDPSTAPRFQWRHVPLIDRPRVRFETALGRVEAELFHREAPTTVSNFLYYVERRLYNDGQFVRALTNDGATASGAFAVVEVMASPVVEESFGTPIPLEPTSTTGLKHEDGTLSMVRTAPGTARTLFRICIGDQPALDAGGKAADDGQGFAAFGRVVDGMELVRRIHAAPAEDGVLTPPIQLQRAVRLE